MKRSDRTARLPLIAASGILVLICAAFQMSSIAPPIPPTNALPTDAHANLPGCAVAPATFDSWFVSGTHAPNGRVNPADSTIFPDIPNCSFYEWSEQMFLWLTSPVGSTQVFRTNTFFDVSPPDPTTGLRTFIPHPASGVLNVEQGQAIPNFSGVLETQATPNGSLVYYMTTVNDVYAFLVTGVKANDPLFLSPNPVPTHFPVSTTDLAPIVQFAAGHHVTLPDKNALAIMVKSSWVLAASLPNPSSYITIMATVPTYDTLSNPPNWVFNGTQTVQLALVGMHVCGTTSGDPSQGTPNGHPEFIWATFEHQDNAPRAQYKYINTAGATVTVNPDLTVNRLFTSANFTGTFNVPHMTAPAIVGQQPNIIPTATVSPSDTIRWKPFGATSNARPNPAVSSATESNTEIISINNSVIGPLTSADVRSNYVMTGATWTIAGAPPTQFFQNNGLIVPGAEVGTPVLQNATLETYNQGKDTLLTNAGTNGPVRGCFECHGTNRFDTPRGFIVSHDFGNLQPMTSFTPNRGYTLTSSPFNVFVDLSFFQQGALVLSQISVVPFNKGFTGSVTLSAEDLPKGVSAIFSRDPTTSKSMLMLAVSPQTPSGLSTVIIKGTSGNFETFTAVSLNVQRK